MSQGSFGLLKSDDLLVFLWAACTDKCAKFMTALMWESHVRRKILLYPHMYMNQYLGFDPGCLTVSSWGSSQSMDAVQRNKAFSFDPSEGYTDYLHRNCDLLSWTKLIANQIAYWPSACNTFSTLNGMLQFWCSHLHSLHSLSRVVHAQVPAFQLLYAYSCHQTLCKLTRDWHCEITTNGSSI